MTPPALNIPPKVRFVLYLVGAVSTLSVSYAIDRDWAGEPELVLVTGLAGLLNLLAAAKTDLSKTDADDPAGGVLAAEDTDHRDI